MSVFDELFVLCDKNPSDLINGRNDDKIRTNLDLLGGGAGGGGGGKQFKNEDKKI